MCIVQYIPSLTPGRLLWTGRPCSADKRQTLSRKNRRRTPTVGAAGGGGHLHRLTVKRAYGKFARYYYSVSTNVYICLELQAPAGNGTSTGTRVEEKRKTKPFEPNTIGDAARPSFPIHTSLDLGTSGGCVVLESCRGGLDTKHLGSWRQRPLACAAPFTSRLQEGHGTAQRRARCWMGQKGKKECVSSCVCV